MNTLRSKIAEYLLHKGMDIYRKKTEETLEFESLNEGDKDDINDYLGLEGNESILFYQKSGYGGLQGMYCDGAEFHLGHNVNELQESISELVYTENKHNKRTMSMIRSYLKSLVSLSNDIRIKHHNLICEAKLEILKKHKETIDIIKKK